MKKSIFSKAINAFVIAFVNALMNWVEQWENGAYFFLIIGDNNCSDVAWKNPTNIESYGAHSIACEPRAAALFESMQVTVDMMLEDEQNDEDYRKELQDPELMEQAWYSHEYTESRQKSKKGGEL